MNSKETLVYDNLIPDSLLNEALALISSKGFQYGWKSNSNMNFGHWNLNFSDTGRSHRNRQDVAEDLPPQISKIWDHIQTKILKSNQKLLRAYCNAHTYGTEGYVHKDSLRKEDLTVIVYLNRLWDIDWAGETVLFEKGEIIKSVLPKWRRLFVFPANIKHAARGVSRFCPEARIVLVFKTSN